MITSSWYLLSIRLKEEKLKMDVQISKDELKEYVSKTEFKFHDLKIPSVCKSNEEPVAIDVGYGGVKVFSMHGMHSFPSILFRVKRDSTFLDNETDIKYIDENGNLWYIGDRARDSLEPGSRQIDSDEFYSEKRLETDEFLILMRISIYLGLCNSDFQFNLNNKRIRLCTGLPEEDVERDSSKLRKIISGHHYFKISIGGREFVKVNFDIEEDDIEILSQPQGTIYSMAFDIYGNIPREDLIIDKNVLVLDGGMYTFDTYLSNRADQGISKTWEDFAMHEVHLHVRDIIKEKTGRYINEFDIEKYMMDDRNPSTIRYDGNQRYYFGDAYLNTVKEMATALVKKLKRTYDNFNDVDTVIVTGGTGKAYYPYLEQLIPVDEIMLAERNDTALGHFDAIFSNVVGFFKFIVYLICANAIDNQEVAVSIEDNKKRSQQNTTANKELLNE